MSNKLYVGNLNYTVTPDKLRELFSQVGTVVDATVITDRSTGCSKGFGFVEMSNDNEAQQAITTFDQQEFEQRKMVVNEARPKQPRQNMPRNNYK